MNTNVFTQIEKYKVLILFGFSLLLFIKFPPVLRWFDFSAAPIDLGILTVVPLVVMLLLTFIMLTNMLIGHYWTILAEYAEYYLSGTFKSLESWQKVSFYMVFFLGLLFVFVVTLVALM
jgi:hypothetical protein